MSLWLKAPAKLNLTLDVLRRRPDGFHDIASVMVPLGLHDDVGLDEAEALSLSADLPDLPTDEGNLALQAATLLQTAAGTQRGAHIRLVKRIPVAAGLAGGSTDAAQVLLGLNRLWDLGLAMGRLLELAAELGSDVPFCLLSQPALAEGRGERLTLLPAAPHLPLVLAKLDLPKSTGEVYRSLDLQAVKGRPDQERVRRGLAQEDPAAVAGGLGNVLESVMFRRYPQLAALRAGFMERGALGAGMSGSGPTIFALAPSAPAAEELAAWARGEAPWVVTTHVGPPPL
ncbi:MAG: 4-(cytidine 5'-diphospho)-2-C-methyl-D-erythritol kinase [Symbiobacteriia bacterium]